MPPRPDAYRTVAPFYDAMAWVYSGGAIAACRRWCAGRVASGERVLIAGGGSGAEALEAAALGARVTLVDASAAMLDRARRRLRRHPEGARVELRHADVLDHRDGPYDAVLAAFFLNVFEPPRLPAVLGALGAQLVSHGRLIVGDFTASTAAATAGRLYHDLPMRLFARLGANPVHPRHELTAALEAAGFAMCAARGFRVGGLGPEWIGAWVARRGPG